MQRPFNNIIQSRTFTRHKAYGKYNTNKTHNITANTERKIYNATEL